MGTSKKLPAKVSKCFQIWPSFLENFTHIERMDNAHKTGLQSKGALAKKENWDDKINGGEKEMGNVGQQIKEEKQAK